MTKINNNIKKLISLEEYPINTFSEETKKELIEFIKFSIKSVLKELEEDVAMLEKEIHGGGNGRRLLIQHKDKIRSIINEIK